MKINYVEIKNFRSIKNEKIYFDPKCRVLVGINESGKSNILKSLSFLSDSNKPNKKDDLREALPDENPIKESYVRFVFKFTKDESEELFKQISAKVLSKSKNPNIVTISTKKENLQTFCNKRNEGLYSINIIDESKAYICWKISDTYKILPEWKKTKNTCPPDLNIELDGQQHKLSNYTLIKTDDFSGIPNEYLEPATIDDLSNLANSAIREITKQYRPNALIWKYEEKNLLPNNINIDTFASNPNSCTPLKNMFNLSDIYKIKESIEEAKKGTENQFQNYLNRIANKTTNHFREVWKEYKHIEFSLKLNAGQIIPGIKEKNTHDFARRSDGFKRFITFLLIISVNVKTHDLIDSLLLIDEPDISLHPSGAKYLRDELIRISRTNYVVYSTHSIFMIDSGNISRHIIVKKKNEVTNFETANESNLVDEEVLYNALGYSIFEILKEKNIIFEGWKDKKLFQVAVEKAESKLKNKFKNVGICHATGVKSIKSIASMIELGKRDCIIISDSDKPAKEKQKEYKKEKGTGKWKTYQDVKSEIKAITGEDFIRNSFITKQVNAALTDEMPKFTESDLSQENSKTSMIKNWLIKNGMNAEQAKDALEDIKNKIFEDLKFENIEDTYFTLLKSIKL